MVQSEDERSEVRYAFGVVSNYLSRAQESHRRRFDSVQTKAALLVTFSGALVGIISDVSRPFLAIATGAATGALVVGIVILAPRRVNLLKGTLVRQALFPSNAQRPDTSTRTLVGVLDEEAKSIDSLEDALTGVGRLLRIGFILLSCSAVSLALDRFFAAYVTARS